MREKAQSQKDVDFLIVIGKSRLLIFNPSDFNKRLDLREANLSRENSKYLAKFESLKAENIADYYIKDDFDETTLQTNFRDELFKFSLAYDRKFANISKILRAYYLKFISEYHDAVEIVELLVKRAPNTSKKEIASSITDSLVLRMILVRVLEGKFGYEHSKAKSLVKLLGLGTIDSAIAQNSKKDFATFQKLFEEKNKKSIQLDIFESVGYSLKDGEATKELRKESLKAAKEEFSGDLYIGDIADAATEIENLLSPEEWSKTWEATSNSQFDFDLSDVTPNTIGEQYEMTMQYDLEEGENGKLTYQANNAEQRDSGSYYTPEYITNYIVEQTLGTKLKDIYKALLIESKESKKKSLLKEFVALKVADISSGGGTFLASAIRCFEKYYNQIISIPDLSKVIESVPVLRDVYTLKRFVAENNIYGVDLNLKALVVSSFALSLETLGVEVSQLPLLLGRTLIHQDAIASLVPEEQKAIYFETYKDKIIELVSERKKYMAHKKNKFEEVRQELLQIFRSSYVEFLKTKRIIETNEGLISKKIEVLEFNIPEVFFDAKGNLSGGFDVVVGNPPYLLEGRISKETFKTYKLSPYYLGKMDLWYLFASQSIDYLKDDGLFGIIATNKWTTNAGAKKFRNKVIKDTSIIQLVDFGNYKIFDNASIQTNILVVKKDRVSDDYEFDLRKLSGNPTEETILASLSHNSDQMIEYLSPKIVRSVYEDSFLTFSSNDKNNILKQMIVKANFHLEKSEITNGIHSHFDTINKKLSQKSGFNIGEGIFVLTQTELETLSLTSKYNKLIKPYYVSDEVRRYYTNKENKNWIIYTNSKYKATDSLDEYPKLKKHLDKYKDVITSDNKPYGLHRSRNEKFFTSEKIAVLRKSVKKPLFSYSDFDCYLSATYNIINTERVNLKYLTGILNSTLIAFWLKNKGKMQGENYQLDNAPLLQLPLVIAETDFVSKITSLVDVIISATKKNLKADTKDFELEIDNLVYQIYGLSTDEIKIVEEEMS